MNEFLREYSPKETREPRSIWKYVLAVLGVLIVAGGIYWVLRDRGEISQVNAFVDDLKAKNYKSAYARFGCTDAKPCKNYPMERFLEDWGPMSPAAKTEKIKLIDRHSCSSSMIQTLDLGGGETVTLIVNRSNKTIGFSPWKVCNPRMQING